MEKKVLVGCIVNKENAFCLDKFLEHMKEQDFQAFDLTFVHDGKDKELAKKLEAAGTVLTDTSPFEHEVERRVRAREALKEKALDGYSHLMFIDLNVMLPPNGISRLLFHDKKIVTGVYLTNMQVGDKRELCPTLFDFAQDGLARVMELREVMGDRLIEISCAGLGCCMIATDVLKDVKFRYFERSKAGDDIAFFVDTRSAGHEAYADTSVKCNNVVSQDDEQNRFFSFDSYPTIRNPRVLAGCVTYDKDEIYLQGLLESIRSQDYPNIDILLVDTSDNGDYMAKLKGTGSIVIRHSDKAYDHKIKRITGGRNAVRDYALKNGYDYVWFVDTDVMPPPGALSKLLSDRKDVVAGLCLISSNFKGSIRIVSNTYDFDSDETYCRPKFIPAVLNNNVVPVRCAGFGCTLVSRQVLEKVSMRFYEKSMAGEDIAFFVDAQENGYVTFADNSVRCKHLVFPPGDPRNRKFFFESYEKGEDFTFTVDGVER